MKYKAKLDDICLSRTARFLEELIQGMVPNFDIGIWYFTFKKMFKNFQIQQGTWIYTQAKRRQTDWVHENEYNIKFVLWATNSDKILFEYIFHSEFTDEESILKLKFSSLGNTFVESEIICTS